jgi:uncharacterized protein
MSDISNAAREFLPKKRIAVAGVSRKGDVAANGIYKKLRAAGYEVFAVNPKADEVEGDSCYHDLASIPGGVDGVVIATHPSVTMQLVKECAGNNIQYVWMHRSFGAGSVDDEAVTAGKELGLKVIPGSCPLMFCEPVDIAHRCLRWFLRVSGKEAQPVY